MVPWLWRLVADAESVPGLSARSLWAIITAFLLCVVAMPAFERFVRRRGWVDRPMQYGGLNVLTKSGVPSMGGAVIMGATLLSALIWCRVASGYVLIALATGVYFAVVGALDDLGKARGAGSSAGLSRRAKYAAQIGLGGLLALLILWPAVSPIREPDVARSLYLPVTDRGLFLGLAMAPFIVFFIVFSSNSVNLTDGMDGLAIVPVIFVAVVLGLFAYLASNVTYSEYLHLNRYVKPGGKAVYHTLRGAGELTVLCSAIAGSGVAFLWYNAHPASIFMGDTGSLALGGMLGAVAVLIRQEAIFFIAGGLLVAELGSSFIQDYIGLKLLGRRILPRAPLHLTLLHHGTGETKVTVRLWIISAACAVIALATLRMR